MRNPGLPQCQNSCQDLLRLHDDLLIRDVMQTHKKKSNRSPNHFLPSLPDEAIQLAVVEHRPYRTSHVVCISWLSILFTSPVSNITV